MTRDPCLPSPEVCDWLLAQDWSKPAVVHISSPESKGWRDDSCCATTALGRDGVIELLAFAEDLEMLREDQRRRAEAIDQRLASMLRAAKECETRTEMDWHCSSSADNQAEGWDPETALLQTVMIERILTEAKQSNLTVNQVADALHNAAQSLISRACAVTLQDHQP